VAAAIAAFVPLVLQPLRAQLAERRARTMPERSAERAEALAAASRAAPWDPRYPAKLAFLHYRLAQDEPDAARRRALLGLARTESARATTLEPQSGDNRVNLGEIEVEQALLTPPAATEAEAVSTLRQAMAIDTANGLMLERIGFALARLGRKDEAHALALHVAALYPDLGAPLGIVGLLALDQGRTADGVDTLRIALAREWHEETAAHASAWSNLSVGYLRARRYREARDAAAEALRLAPGLKSARDNQALAEGTLKTLGELADSTR
jgi:tetratricopeptide (TPR) repeat protein